MQESQALAGVFFVAFAIPIIWPDVHGGCLDYPDCRLGSFLGGLCDQAGPGTTQSRLCEVEPAGLGCGGLSRPTSARPVGGAATASRRKAEGHVAAYVTFATTTVVGIASLAVLQAERHDPANANITTFGEAVWWSLVTVTTVGYGDFYPVTMQGRVIATLLMLSGIALLGVVTAGLASWLISRISDSDESDRTAKLADIQDVQAELRLLRSELAALRGPGQIDDSA